MLTERKIRDARPGAKTILLRDTKVVGLACRVAAGGTRSFVLDYRVGGKRRLATLGRCSEMSLADARALAGRELVAIRAGEADPVRDRQAAKDAPTVADGLDRFFGEYAPRRIADGLISERTVYDYRKQSGRTIRPRLGSMKIADVSQHDIARALANTAPVQRNRQLALLSRLFNLWQRWEWCEPGHNPARLLEKTREEPRDRTLAPSEIAALGAALSGLDNPIAAAALRFLMLTGWRNGEALALRWEDVNLETGEIILRSTKTGRDRRTVGAAALDILASLPRFNRNPHCFAGSYGAAVSYKTLASAFKRACQGAGIADARLHDIRRTMATAAASTGLNLIGLRDLLNHRTTTMAARYARRADSVLRATQDDMAARMDSLMKGETADVREFRRG